jgi:hypothetical protein
VVDGEDSIAQSESSAADAFTAYGVTQEFKDPIDVLLHQMMDEMKRQQKRIQDLESQGAKSDTPHGKNE